ncbi:MAG TPA: mucoidy inhibitor MuiA family protein [Sandaracinaceae bacterium LLY-WYZ-13_1]|nr:mucoidy inhibitor MuiA family protein [Sandaracinaceae bacterium LLY-WYZ-13_1]
MSGARRTIEVLVDEVTLMEDRARVVRRATVDLPAGVHRLTIEDVAPVLLDKTLAARLDAGRVRGVRAVREALHRPASRDEALRALDASLEEARDAVRRLDRRVRRLEDALRHLAEAGEQTVRELSEDAAWSRADAASSGAHLDALAERERGLREARVGAHRELAERRRELSRLEARRRSAASPRAGVRAHLWVDLELEGGGPHHLEVEYVAPNACWRPAHRATLAGDRVRFETEGCVWQNTGEDWPDASLRLSTQRPSLGVEPPRLSTDRLRVKRRSEAVHVEQRQRAVETSGLGRDVTAAPELPGIDDGGETLELRATHRARVPSDGRPHRVPLFEFTADAQATLRCVPELTAAVLLESTQPNAGPHPILAGPVDLVRGGGFVGRTTVLFVAPGERFELGWGPDPALRVRREVDEREPETNLLRSWIAVEKRVTIALSNLGAEAKRLELVERVPVSELEKVKIDVDREHTTDGRAPDADGMLRWTVELAPFGRDAVDLRWTLRRHADVVGL